MNALLIRPYTRMLAFIRAKPLLAVLLFAAGWYVVVRMAITFERIIGDAIGRVLMLVGSLPVVGSLADIVGTWLQGRVWTFTVWAAAFSIGGLFPPLGVFILAMQLVATFKRA